MKRSSKRRLIRSAIACGLAVVMTIMHPVQSLAWGYKTEYISELRISTAKTDAEAINWLKENGYKVVYDKDLNEGTENGAVRLGYKTTTDPKKAITDMKFMNMSGGFSYTEYNELLKKEEREIGILAQNVQKSINEFRANFKEGSAGAELGYDIMNRMREDDSGKLMGDFLLNEALSEKDLVKVIMQGNTLGMGSIYMGIAMGCSETGKENWLKRLSDIGPNQSLSTKYENKARSIYSEYWDSVRDLLLTYADASIKTDSSKWLIERWKSENGEKQFVRWTQGGVLYEILNRYPYEDMGTLADFFMRDKDELEEEMGMEAFYPIVKAMTEGQYEISKFVGLDYMIQVAGNSEKMWNNAEKQVMGAMSGEYETEVVSIYDGVDRTLFDGGIALTSEAAMKVASSGDSWFSGNMSETAEKVFYWIMGIAGGVGLLCSATLLVSWIVTWILDSSALAETTELAIESFLESATFAVLGKAVIWGAIAGVVIAIAVAITFLILELIYYYNPDYTEIPRMMVDEQKNENGKTIYPYYYAAKDQDGKEADVNAWKAHQWVALYTTKDSRAGAPLKANIICKSSRSEQEEWQVPVSLFGSKAPYNLNYYDFDSSSNVFMFYVPDTNVYTGSSFSTGNVAMTAGLGALGGILIGAFSTTMVGKRKKKPVTA